MRSRPIAVVLILLALLLAGWFVWKQTEVADANRATLPAAESKREAALAPAPETMAALDAAVPERALVQEAASSTTAPAGSADFGTIVVLDESGVEHARESGSFQLLVIEPRMPELQVTVKDGTWSHPLPEGAKFFVSQIRLGDRHAIALPRSGPFVAGAQAPRLRCEWASVARLHVVDAGSGAELDGIHLVRVSAWDALGVEPMKAPPMKDPVGSDLTSPIEVRYEPAAHDSGPPMHFAHREGYAWGSIQIDPTAGGEFFLKLQPVGALRMVFEGASRDPRLRLRLYRRLGPDVELVQEWGGDQLDESPRPAISMKEMLAGDYAVRAELGILGKAQVLAEQEFSIISGKLNEVLLAVGSLRPLDQVEVTLKLELDPLWTLERFTLMLYFQDVVIRSAYKKLQIRSGDMIAVDARTWTSKPMTLAAGRYRLNLEELHFAIETIVGPGPKQQIVLNVPAPGRVLVRVVDGETGEPASGASLRWGCKGSSSALANLGDDGPRESSVGEFEFLAPSGTVQVDATGKRAFATQTLEVLPGLNNVTLTLLPDYSVEIVLREGDELVPWPIRAMNDFKFERVDGEPLQGTKSTSFTSGRMTCYVTTAGVYRVTIPQLPGYRAVDPFEVTVDRRTLVEKVIQIVRE